MIKTFILLSSVLFAEPYIGIGGSMSDADPLKVQCRASVVATVGYKFNDYVSTEAKYSYGLGSHYNSYDFFIISAKDVAFLSAKQRQYDIESHPNVKKQQPRMLSVESIQPYKNRWDLLGLQD